MICDDSFDIFEDLFGDQNERLSTSPNGIKSLSSEYESSDSGHGSPAGSAIFSNSDSLVGMDNWESNMDDTFWGSILDELPDELSDDGVENQTSPIMMNYTHQTMNTPIKNELTPVEPEQQIEEAQQIEEKPITMLPPQSTKKIATDINTFPVILKEIDSLENSSVKSHIKIGNKLFAIVQKSDLSVTNIVSPPPSKPVVEKASLPPLNYHPEPKYESMDDHDYTSKETLGCSKGTGPGLILTDEEKRLLELENASIPENCGLTKDEEKILKKVRRKIKNKQSAMESRRRRREYIDNLERRVKSCTDVNNSLKRKVDSLTNDNKNLLTQLKQLQALVTTSIQQNRNTQNGSCLAMLVLSFAFFFLPFNPMAAVKNTNNVQSTQAPQTYFRSRTLLQLDDSDNASQCNAYPASLHDNAVAKMDALNSSLVFSDDVRNKVEQLLLHGDDDQLKVQLDSYMGAGGYSATLELNNCGYADEHSHSVVESK